MSKHGQSEKEVLFAYVNFLKQNNQRKNMYWELATDLDEIKRFIRNNHSMPAKRAMRLLQKFKRLSCWKYIHYNKRKKCQAAIYNYIKRRMDK